MNVSRLAVAMAWTVVLATSATRTHGPNPVPEEPATAANYWCTWYAQNYWIQRGGEITDMESINNPNAREQLSYDTDATFPHEVRSRMTPSVRADQRMWPIEHFPYRYEGQSPDSEA